MSRYCLIVYNYRRSHHIPQDGFTHLTADPALLLSVANHFYQQSQGPWTVLELSTASLDGKVRYERAAPVGSTAAHEAQQLFPHLYGGINRAAVLALHLMTRDEDGRFLGVPSLGIHTVDENLKIHHHVTNV